MELTFYAATSLDGFLADSKHSVGWLDKFNEQIVNLNSNSKIRNSYNEFYKNIDFVIMGKKTYSDIKGFDVEYPYKSIPNYVVTSDKNLEDENISDFLCYDELKEKLKTIEGHGWVIGGGQLFSSMLDDNLIDTVILSTMPIILGDGVKIFNNDLEHDLDLEEVEADGNFIEIKYKVKKK